LLVQNLEESKLKNKPTGFEPFISALIPSHSRELEKLPFCKEFYFHLVKKSKNPVFSLPYLRGKETLTPR
jgi:hypothetical protein